MATKKNTETPAVETEPVETEAAKTETAKAADKKASAAAPEGDVVEASEKKPPEELVVKTREGYTITGRKPSFGDRSWFFAQPEGMKIPLTEVLPAACIKEIVKPDGSTVNLEAFSFPWFVLAECGIEGPMVYMSLWNQTYMPGNDEVMAGIVYAMSEMKSA